MENSCKLWIQQNYQISGLCKTNKLSLVLTYFFVGDRVGVWEGWEEYEILDGF